jgi:hypothetical protein
VAPEVKALGPPALVAPDIPGVPGVPEVKAPRPLEAKPLGVMATPEVGTPGIEAEAGIEAPGAP